MPIYQPTPTEIETAAAALHQQYPADPGRIQHAAALLLAGRLEYETAQDRNAIWQRLGLDVTTPTDPGWRCVAPHDPRRNQGDDATPRWYAVAWDRCQCWDYLAGPGLCKHIYALRLYASILNPHVAGAATVLDAAPSARYPNVFHLCEREGADICTAEYNPRRDTWTIQPDGSHLAAFAMWLAANYVAVEAAR